MRLVIQIIGVFLAGLALVQPLRAQDSEATGLLDRLEMRAIATGSGSEIIVDRGSNDRIEVGDLVTFYPRKASIGRGRVSRVEERSAYVRLGASEVLIPVGTRAEIMIPREREVVIDQPEPAVEVPITELPEQPPWEYTDDDWTSDKPLLAEIKAIRPENRTMIMSGRVYVIGDINTTNEDGRSDSFYRLGTDLDYMNPFGKGGNLHIDAELNTRLTNVPDQNDDSETLYRLDRLSYVKGGTRFVADRTEYGRFLQRGMPEFGVLDGYESGRATSEGEYFGWSFGFMPEPDKDYQTGEDSQIAINRRWVLDDFSGLSVEGGYQKTFHEGNADRDLFVVKVVRLPSDDWDFYGTALVDYYTSGDDLKGSGIELTELHLSTHRTYGEDSGIGFTYSSFRFPYLEREEFAFVDAGELIDGETNRIWVDGWMPYTRSSRVRGRVGAWKDEDDAGGDAEASIELDDWVFNDTLATITVFGTNGKFSDSIGLRGIYNFWTENGSWDLSGELSNRQQDNFSGDLQDLPIGKVRIARTLRTRSNWDLQFYFQALSWQDNEAFSLGFFGQKSF